MLSRSILQRIPLVVKHTFTVPVGRPQLPYGYSYKASCARPDLAVICNFCHPGTLTLSPERFYDLVGPERQSVQISKISNDVRLNPVWHRVLYSCTHMATAGVKGLNDSQNSISPILASCANVTGDTDYSLSTIQMQKFYLPFSHIHKHNTLTTCRFCTGSVRVSSYSSSYCSC